MCGIAGKLYADPERSVEIESLQAMVDTLRHRGPDDEGFYREGSVGLGMRRLAIIDLATGHQPIHNEDGTVWAVCNGEIYNFPELRSRLESRGHRFYTRSDTEVIVHAYEEYGTGFLNLLRGMFAIALWDARRRRLLLARDRLGIKPLFYANLPDRLLFGSEIKALLADRLRPTIDVEAVSHYLSLLYVPAPLTIYREIRKLEAGQLLVWRDGAIDLRTYWDPSALAGTPTVKTVEEARERLRELLGEAVRAHLLADVPIGVFLSGGLDSSTVLAMIRRSHAGRLQTFSVGFEEASYNELADARLVAHRFATDHHEIVLEPDVEETVLESARFFDEPFADSSAIPTYHLSAFARRDVTVALSGDGGDELFAGYLTYQADRLAPLYERLPGVLRRRLLPALTARLPVGYGKLSFDLKLRRFLAAASFEPARRHYAWKTFFDDAMKATLLEPELLVELDGKVDSFPVFGRFYEELAGRDRLNRFLYADMRLYLADDILVKVDRMSMAHSLEVRVPLLDHRVVELMLSLPGRWKMPGLGTKRFLRQAMTGILPRKVVRKSKAGFNIPVSLWLKRELRPMLDQFLSPEMVKAQGVFRTEEVCRLMREHLEGRADHGRNLWALLMFSVWHERVRRP